MQARMTVVEAAEAVESSEEEEAEEAALRVREMVRVVKWLFAPPNTRLADIPMDTYGALPRPGDGAGPRQAVRKV